MHSVLNGGSETDSLVFVHYEKTGGIMKKLEEMNLVDDFLVNSLISHKEYGEKASKYILECIFNRKIKKLLVVPQRFWIGEDTESHGVRLDVYLDEENGEIFDIEPDQNDGKEETESLPRRVRFYHAKIDSGNLGSGEEYKCLRNVIVIFITTYDPFGRDRMMYTIKNQCVEEPDMLYEDGAKSIFLYTKGTKGNPSEDLKDLLHYMENSTEEYAQTKDLKALHRMVTEVKHDGKVGFAYMKSFEREQRIKEQSRQEGKAEGKAEALLQILSCRGTVSESLRECIMSEHNSEILDLWVRDAIECKSIEEFVRKKTTSL